MKTAFTVLVMSTICVSAIVPFFNDASYQRAEPVSPPWFVRSNRQPSLLYHNGSYVSQESGTNDLNLMSAWRMQRTAALVGMIDQSAHGDRVQGVLQATSPASWIYRHELLRWYVGDIASGIVDCVHAGCKVVTITTGFSSPDTILSNACRYAEANGVLLVCSVPDADGDLDSSLIDYPYRWSYVMSNILPATSSDRNGNHYSPAATGTNCLAAPGRNIVAAGSYSSGTSYAAPILTGCAAMLRARYPNWTPAECIAVLRQTAIGPARRVNPTAALSLVPVRATCVPMLELNDETE